MDHRSRQSGGVLTSTTVIVGGGVGGLATAKALRKRLGREHRIVVVDRDDQHRFAASLLWVLSGDRQPADLARPLARLAARGVEFVRAAVSAIDPATRTVTLDDGRTLTGDHLSSIARSQPASRRTAIACTTPKASWRCATPSLGSIGGA